MLCLEVEIIKVNKDTNGHILIITIKCEDTIVALCNICAPNTDNPQFFADMITMLEGTNSTHKIIGGDFNLVMDPDKDRLNSKHNHNKSLEIKHIDEAALCDIWRIQNPN